MIEIKQSRKLHESGFRLMQIANSSNEVEVINEAADVLNIGFKGWLDGLHLDITSKGVIRIWSNNFDLIPNKKFSGSDSIFMVAPKENK